MNAIGNLSNRFQGEYRRVLAVCSAGLLRSPTIAHTLAGAPYNYNTRSAGLVDSYALNVVDERLLAWAQEIVCADYEHFMAVCQRLEECEPARHNHTVVICLGIPDIYSYRDSELVRLIHERYQDPNVWDHSKIWQQGEWKS